MGAEEVKHLLESFLGRRWVCRTTVVEIGNFIPFRKDIFDGVWFIVRECIPSRPLPASLCCPATHYLEQTSGGRLIVCINQMNQLCDVDIMHQPLLVR